MNLRGLLAATAVPALFLAGCGSSDTATDPTSATSATSESPESAPPAAAAGDGTACNQIWVDQATLPTGYESCTAADGGEVEPETVSCSSGQELVLHDGSFYAVRGGRITEADLATDEEYLAVMESCVG